ncbi:MAG: hypothetical protein CVV64_17275 [Candidatus Wallbacteria bacterium HGW-Wallbacteria-1]|jgi:pilus assembly protein TadC|uniref:Uncharacterized protein n=1 Tax=Candidatus Wallbacteria bacterium HGW-Wallbacteria-1 TaxID=2013854 RepID=A0A2N1PKE4_9BACT|nr:MAG: hypothetical protein CVV64_17275 [Candidatus Wallbacteria bacterium HGW-Wallbacteria-1]
MEGLVAIILIFGLPCLAVISSHREKIRKMELQHIELELNLRNSIAEGQRGGTTPETARQVEELLDRVAVLEERITQMGSEIDNISEHQEFTEKLLRKTERENPREGLSGASATV